MSNGQVGGLLRQGDLLLVPVPTINERLIVARSSADRHVLAEGEASGHAHVVSGESTVVVAHRKVHHMAPPRVVGYLVVEEGRQAVLEHEEHLPIPIAPGTYEVRRQREYRPARSVRVAD